MFSTHAHGIWTVVHPIGEIDIAVGDEFRHTILEALNQHEADHLAIDFSEVTFLDSSGLSVIATALKETKARGTRLVLVGLSERTLRVLEITGMTKILDIRDRLTGNDDEFAVEWILEQPELPAAS